MAENNTPTNVVDDYITALKQEASKYKTFDEYEKAFSREYKRGIYYHLTDNPNFVVDLSKGATDAATGKMTPGSIMFTTDLDYWADTTWTDRPYVAILDLSDVDESQFTQVNTGQGNEFYLDDASNVKVKEVIPVDEALKQSELINQWGLDNLKNKEDLKKLIWDNKPDIPTNVVDDKLKRINEILEEGIKATGIDADPNAPNYLTDYPTEHGDLIRELEKNVTLEELQNLVGGEEKLGNLIGEIAEKQSEVSPRYLSATPPLNEYGEEFGAKGAYGITTAELQQKEIQDVIKNFIDTPTNVVDDAVEYIDNLNIDNAIKKEVKDKVIKVTGQASGAVPIPGVGQAIDAWETAVLVVGAAALAAGEIDELPKVIYNYGLDLYESILSGYNISFQPAKRKEYNPNFERISSGLTWIDKLQPTSYVINPVIEEFQETAATTPTMEVPGFGTVPASEYYQPPVQSTPERDNINTIMTNLMTNISNAQGAYPITASELSNFQRNPIQVVPQDTADKTEKVVYDSEEKQKINDNYARLMQALSESLMR